MSSNLKQIKKKIQAVKKTGQVAAAMETVSAVKMRKAQEKALAMRPYATAAVSILARLSSSKVMASHPLVRPHPLSVGKQAYIIVTSDKGLAGGLNSAVLRAVAGDIVSEGLTRETVSIVAIGRKANDFFARRGYSVEVHVPNTEVVSPTLIRELVDDATLRFTSGAAEKVKVAYQCFVSTFEQRPAVRTLLPLSLAELEAVVREITPEHGKYAGYEAPPAPATYTFEPGEQEVLEAILPRLAGIVLYHVLLESQASEHSARMVAMRSASDKAEEIGTELLLSFNKARQAAITREVSEIVAGGL